MASLLLCACLLLTAHLCSAGFYLASDYVMDPKVSKTFKGVCEETISDDFAWFTSHIHIWKTRKYPKNKDCWVRINPGSRSTARTKFFIDFMDIDCSDTLEVYDGFTSTITAATPNRTFCGGKSNFNMTGIPSGPTAPFYTVFRWVTDGNNNGKGFRFGALRYEIPTNGTVCRTGDPNGDYFLCPSEGICIDPRLQCDGTAQCWYGEDEQGCSGTEKFVGGLLKMGLQGLITMGIGLVLGIVVIVVVIVVTLKLVKSHQKKKAKQAKKNAENGDEGEGQEAEKGKTGLHSGTVSPAPATSPPPAEPAPVSS